MCTPGTKKLIKDPLGATGDFLADPGKSLASADPVEGIKNEMKKNMPTPVTGDGPGADNGKTFKGAERAAVAAPSLGARRRGNSAMGAGSLLTGPSGIAAGALTTGRSTLLGQ